LIKIFIHFKISYKYLYTYIVIIKVIQEEIDGAWKEFIENKEKNAVKKTEYIKNTEDINDTEEDTIIDGAWKEFIEIKSKPTEKVEYIKVTEDDIDNEEETSEEEYECSAWNNFKTIESEEKLKKSQAIVSIFKLYIYIIIINKF